MRAECGSWCCASWWCALTTELGTCSDSPWHPELLLRAAGKSFKSRDLEKLALQQVRGLVSRHGAEMQAQSPQVGEGPELMCPELQGAVVALNCSIWVSPRCSTFSEKNKRPRQFARYSHKQTGPVIRMSSCT